MSLRNAFSRPSGSHTRAELAMGGAELAIVAYAEAKESLASGKADPNSAVVHHSALLLKVRRAVDADAGHAPISVGVTLRFDQHDSSALLRADWNAASTVWLRVVAGGAWSADTPNGEEGGPAAADGAAEDAAAARRSAALLAGVPTWRVPGRPVTVADLHEPWGWYDLRFNNCQHFVHRAQDDLALTEVEAAARRRRRCLVS